MEHEELPLASPEHVLATLNPDGTRRWLAPRLAKGRFWQRRRIVAYLLIAVFNLLPWIPIGGKPAMFLDIVHRQFTFFGVTFQPTETVLVTTLFLSIFVSVFLATALFGRVWCGWGCPQTVYLEFLYRPLERLAEGKWHSKGRAAIPPGRKLLKYALFLIVSVHLAHTFLAYFVGAKTVMQWSVHNPASHPMGFAIVWGVVGMMMFDFASFREQLCTLACPYGRLQSALLDPNSIVIGYDAKRGEPRGKGKRGTEKTENLGDCIECKLCVAVCPTGIDIRDGLQMECVNCAECIDACDSVMDRIGAPRGLIRYASENELVGLPKKRVRVRTVLYSVVLTALLVAFVSLLGTRKDTLVNVLRINGVPYTHMADGRISDLVKLRIENRREDDRTYTVTLTDSRLETNPSEVTAEVSGLGTKEVTFSVLAPASIFADGRADLEIMILDDEGLETHVERTLLGPR
jgi:cytochrome c oxidase accessory protein FixG